MQFTGTLSGLSSVAAGINRVEADVDRALDRAMQRTALGGQSIVRGKARGRPGPRSITGDYNRSIVGQAVREGPSTFLAVVGSSAPQTLRLEFGFVGPDALGRYYNQPPFPHFGPSLEPMGELAMAEVRVAVGGAI